jgi:aubergine-like protein
MEKIQTPMKSFSTGLTGIEDNNPDKDEYSSTSYKKTDSCNFDFNSTDKSNSDYLDIEFLPNPKLVNLNYVSKKVNLYSNLYKISVKKSRIFFEYSVKFQHDEVHLSTQLKRKVISKISSQISERYGVYIFTGNTLFSSTEIKEMVNLFSIYKKFQYSIVIVPTKERVELTNCPKTMLDLYKRKPEVKMILELIIKDILRHNPNLKFVKNLYGKKYAEKSVQAKNEYNSISIMPGFCTKVMFIEKGIFLNVDIKNKILSSSHCLDLINSYMANLSKPKREEIEKINKFFKGRTVETIHTNQRFRIEMVNFEKRANNYSINFESTPVILTQYYKKLYDIDINPNSPLLLIKSKGKNEQNIGRYYPPELCLMVGLTDEMLQDFNLMKKIASVTKQDPENKVADINDIIKLVNDKKGISKVNKIDAKKYVLKSAFEKKEEYGIDITEVNSNSTSLFQGFMIKNPVIKGKDDKIISDIRRPFEILNGKKINYLCIYHEEYEIDRKKLESLMKAAGEPYGITIGKADFKKMSSEDSAHWIAAVEKNFSAGTHNLVIFLLDDYLKLQVDLYRPLKKHSLESKGYITQIIVTNSLHGKNSLSIISNVLIQINSKIGGTSYKVEMDNELKKKNLMLVGVDTSLNKSTSGEGGKTIVAMCASLNKTFTEYTHKKFELEKDMKNSLVLPLSTFIYEALCEFFKINKKLPGGIIIYRQGVSKEQKFFLTAEIDQISSLLESKGPNAEFSLLEKVKIPFYYILVNKKTSLKFFECEALTSKKANNTNGSIYNYENPDPGLLVINSMTDPEIFEFYLQPQKVNQGTATPTNFHVAFGNMACPEIIPKLTYDLCYLYCNWRGPVRVPAPLKYAEKLAKTSLKINDKIKNTLCYI